jgi:hypothetical protein
VVSHESGDVTVKRCVMLRKYISLKITVNTFPADLPVEGPPLWSSGQSFWLQIQRSRGRFPALADFLGSKESGTVSTQPHEGK